MKQEEAVERLKVALRCYEYATDKDFAALIEVTKAFEKETPKKPERLNAFRSIGKCRGCEKVISTRTASAYCQYCGNKVDWRNEDEA